MREWVVFAEMVQDSIAEDLERRRMRDRQETARFVLLRSTLARFLFRAGRWIAPPVATGAAHGFKDKSWRTSRT